MIAARHNHRGADIVLLHSSGSSARQWDALIERLQSRYRVRAVDFHGHGAVPAWSAARPMTLDDDAALVAPLLAGSERAVHLIGHSYGGAVALKVALAYPRRIASVAVYEPVVFRLLFDYRRRDAAAQSVLTTAASMRAWLARGDQEAAAQRFVDFWSGAGMWQAMPPLRRKSVAARMPSVLGHFGALFHDAMRRAQIATLDLPALFLTGERTIAPTRRIGELLRHALPSARHEVLAGMGHLGPITHATAVNERLATFVEDVTAAGWKRAPLRAAA